ncbi:hypothetical protein Bhyg_09366 [Pseudolycoriella hygida]|uniref:Uncharacterized protein n=1 Tax=Pseudolycoriella hygida TaxID=35572 RepID=A0A9Q0S3V8_9DIPT|nr:hypothetical protein Bhyg_09366 [Pseudolycoriella hygida]
MIPQSLNIRIRKSPSSCGKESHGITEFMDFFVQSRHSETLANNELHTMSTGTISAILSGFERKTRNTPVPTPTTSPVGPYTLSIQPDEMENYFFKESRGEHLLQLDLQRALPQLKSIGDMSRSCHLPGSLYVGITAKSTKTVKIESLDLINTFPNLPMAGRNITTGRSVLIVFTKSSARHFVYVYVLGHPEISLGQQMIRFRLITDTFQFTYCGVMASSVLSSKQSINLIAFSPVNTFSSIAMRLQLAEENENLINFLILSAEYYVSLNRDTYRMPSTHGRRTANCEFPDIKASSHEIHLHLYPKPVTPYAMVEAGIPKYRNKSVTCAVSNNPVKPFKKRELFYTKFINVHLSELNQMEKHKYIEQELTHGTVEFRGKSFWFFVKKKQMRPVNQSRDLRAVRREKFFICLSDLFIINIDNRLMPSISYPLTLNTPTDNHSKNASSTMYDFFPKLKAKDKNAITRAKRWKTSLKIRTRTESPRVHIFQFYGIFANFTRGETCFVTCSTTCRKQKNSFHFYKLEGKEIYRELLCIVFTGV